MRRKKKTPLDFLRDDKKSSSSDATRVEGESVEGATTAPSGTLFKPIKREATTKKFNNGVQEKLQDVSPVKKEDCCETSLRVLQSIDNTLMNMRDLQVTDAQSQREKDAEKTKKPPGTGGFLEGAKDRGADLLEVGLSSLGMLLGSNLKNIADGFKQFGADIGTELSKAGKAIDDGFTNIKNFFDPPEDTKPQGEQSWIDKLVGTINGVIDSTKNQANKDATKVPADSGVTREPMSDELTQALLPLSNLIHKGESSNTETGYDSINAFRGKTFIDKEGKEQRIYEADKMDLSKFTVDQILEKQKNKEFFAAGKYQVEPVTLGEAKQSMNLSGEELFTPELQEEMFAKYLLGRDEDIANYLFGEGKDKRKAATGVSKVFAAVTDPELGRGHYDDVANNRASISSQEIYAALGEVKANILAMRAKEPQNGGNTETAPPIVNNTTIVKGGEDKPSQRPEPVVVVPPDCVSPISGMCQF